MKNSLQNIDVVILCGGLGKRLRPLVNDRPKPMAKIDQRPFLDILIEYLSKYGFKKFILCIGHMGQVVKDHYQKKAMPFKILYSEEKELLGTGGALKNAESLIENDTFLLLNGDSFCRLDFSKLIDFHFLKNATLSIVLTKPLQGDDYGKVELNDDKEVISFQEKVKPENKKYINAGIYLMEKKVFSFMSSRKNKFSLEYDFFPDLIGKKFYGYVTTKKFIDIGTPRQYKDAQKIISKLK